MPHRSKTQGCLHTGYRSGLEERVAQQLSDAGVNFGYEDFSLTYVDPTYHQYTTDFTLPNGIIIEVKGHFTPDDRRKHKWIKEQHPELDIRLLFENAHKRLNKRAKSTYAQWCEKHGIPWAHKQVPQEWLSEETKDAAKTRKD